MESEHHYRDRAVKVVELRDVADARRYVAQGLHFQRAIVPTPHAVSFALKVSLSYWYIPVTNKANSCISV